MTRWKDTLPSSQEDDPQSWFQAAMLNLVEAFELERLGHVPSMLTDAAFAAAEIRAWRKSLPEQGERVWLDPAAWSDRGLLKLAAHHVLFADQLPRSSVHLRHAEAALRELWQRRRQEVAT